MAPDPLSLRALILILVLCRSAALAAQVLPQGVRNILTYSTYLGGASNDSPHAVAVDPKGNVYVVGETVSGDFPVTAGAFQQQHAGVPGTDYSIFTGSPHPDAFIAKFDPTGKIVYCTYLGGSSDDVAYAVAADGQGNAYVAGTTISPNFPVTAGAYETAAKSNLVHSFVTKVNPTGTALIYSTLIGGSGRDTINSLRLDAAGNVYVAGQTTSTDFPVTAGAFQTTAFAGTGVNPNTHGFVAKLNTTGSQLAYATYLTGSAGAYPKALALNSAGEAFITGATPSADFPTTNGAWLTAYPTSGDGFLARLNAAGSALIYSTFVPAAPVALDLDSTGAAYLGGPAVSTFPVTPGAFASQSSSAFFVAKLDPSGSRIVFNAQIGGDHNSVLNAIAVDTQNNIFVTGATTSSNFPITQNAYQTGYSASMCFLPGIGPFEPGSDTPDCNDAFVTELDSFATKLLYSTYLGANGPDYAVAVSLAPDGSIYVAGTTSSAIFPATANALETHRSFGADCTFEGSPSAIGAEPCDDAFLSHLSPVNPAPVAPFEIVNAASFLPGAIVRSELIALFGVNIGPAQPSQSQLDANGLLSTSLGGIRVLFDGTPSPLLYVGPDQINAVVPYNTSGKQKVQVTIETTGTADLSQSIGIALVDPGFVAVAPGLFSAQASGFGEAAAFNEDGTVNGPAHPAAPGSVVGLYATGLGVTNVTVPDGTITVPSLLPLNMGPIEIFIDGQITHTQYAGNAPGFVAGVSQVNVLIPPGTRSGNVPIYVSMGHVVTSQSGMFISVQ